MSETSFFDEVEWDDSSTTDTSAPDAAEDMMSTETDTFADEPGEDGGSSDSIFEPTPTTSSFDPRTQIPNNSVLVDVDIELVFVIDATGSMGPFLDKAKAAALNFMNGLEVSLKENKRKVRNVSARVIAYRDYYCDDEPMRASRFFDLRDAEDTREFSNFINSIEPMGGGDEPESALEALHEAFNSPWSKAPATKRRQIVILITDASAHKLDDPKRYSSEPEDHPTPYPSGMPETLEDLQGEWHNAQIINQNAKRLGLFTPNSDPWTAIGSWQQATGSPMLTTQGGGDEVEMKVIYSYIAKSV